MNAPNPRRLIEVDLPIKAISAHARREKSIRHGHISTMHVWWARRPLASCRAIICAALWPDPADPHCPQSFRDVVAQAMRSFDNTMRSDSHVAGLSPTLWGDWSVKTVLCTAPDNLECWEAMRSALLCFITDFANWDASTVPIFLETARTLTQAAHESTGGSPDSRPLVVDPFAGGGAIPLEALRVGADAFASDLNPVAVLLNKVLLEYIPRYGNTEMTIVDEAGKEQVLHGLAEAVRYWGTWIKQKAEEELAEFYPKDPDGATPIAYLWARTIACEGPGCGAEVPLMRSLWLAKRSNKSVALRIVSKPAEKRVDFEIIEQAKAKDVGEGTVRRGSASCPCCGYTTPVESVRKQLTTRKGGAADARLFCVVTTRPDQQGRFYRLPTSRDLEMTRNATIELEKRKQAHTGALSLVPDEPTPQGGGSGAGRAFSQRNYGMDLFGDLFTPRQLLALTTLARLVREIHTNEGDAGFLDVLQTCLALAVDRQADYLTTLTIWANTGEFIAHTFGRQALPIVWEWPECQLFSVGSGNWEGAINWIILTVEALTAEYNASGQASQASATAHPLPNSTADAFITDPPYYDSVPYADLSDFFYVWLRRTLPPSFAASFADVLTPKDEECILDEVKGKDRTFYEQTMAKAMKEGRRILNPSGVGVIVFAHKSTGGWEAQLQAMVDAGWTITGSWPIDTERPGRLRAQNSAALVSSVHIVCRPRQGNMVGEWRDVQQELPIRIGEWLPRLAAEGVVGADAIFACLGPALEIFSRYDSVEKPNGDVVTLHEYLEQVWAAVSKAALSLLFSDIDTSGLEPDARLTAMWFWTLSANVSNGDRGQEQEEVEPSDTPSGPPASSFSLEYDTARKIAQGLGGNLETLRHVVEVKGSVARLLCVGERTRYLFGKNDTHARTDRDRRLKKAPQINMFAELNQLEEDDGRSETTAPQPGATVLDRVHQAMILFATGRGEAMKRFITEDAGNDPRFWHLAQTLTALYPPSTEEKRWVDGVLARKKGLGF